ncbi:pilin [Crenobacter cavernae]|uniref:Prepilin-type N-terminal cleavage/methylation domain-containing protein n=1 Tax=Crenobacter cavernae TaxID=2290923 RepID=A0ABY0FI17_9NEIS|nr:pilin [Crenobacter cavernae]RXZ44601.1 prepilin-type N-terminal cleavage/methylation domain-containing protein [Crenobacter cavernae]
MKKVQQGFTLIELMIVVAIIGILAAIAIPAYQDYTKRAHVSEGLTLASSAKTAVTEYYATKGSWPGSNASAGLPSTISGNAVKTIAVGATSGVITVTYKDQVKNDAKLTLSPTDGSGGIQWACVKGTDMEDKWLPSNCR